MMQSAPSPRRTSDPLSTPFASSPPAPRTVKNGIRAQHRVVGGLQTCREKRPVAERENERGRKARRKAEGPRRRPRARARAR